MSVRAVWVLLSGGKEKCRLLLSRTFPTVEKRAEAIEDDKYVPVPEPRLFVDAVVQELGLKHSSREFVESRDGCSKPEQKPVFELKTAAGPLWPLLIVEQHGFLYCCLPLVEQGTANRPPLITCPGVSAGFSLLLGMSDSLGSIPRNIPETSLRFADLHSFISVAAPFGTPLDVNPHNVKLHLKDKIPAIVGSQNQKIPAWRPVPNKGRSSLHFAVLEHIRAVQYDNQNIPDVWEIYGSVTCMSEVEGSLPEVTVSLGHASGQPPTQLDHVTVHPCVSSADTEIYEPNKSPPSSKTLSRKFTFTPPAETFTLCHYATKSSAHLPVKGYYQMKGHTEVEILVQLRLGDHVKNSFEYCELQVPFFHRGPVQSIESTPSQGTVLLSSDKKCLVWNIGQKFPKSLEILLKVTLKFAFYNPEGDPKEDKFCIEQNAYAQLLFKIPDYTQTGVMVEGKSVQVHPSTKSKVSTAREYSSIDYKIWNSHGDSPSAFKPPETQFS